ncbi:UPF0481 protein [Rosa sericea]
MENYVDSSTNLDTSNNTTEVHESRINVEALKNSMTAKLRSDSPLPAHCCIFRVPQVLRRHKSEAYGPDVVSIGPFHRGGKQFQTMENVKQWYLHNLLSRLNISLTTLIQSVCNVFEFEKRARAFYAEPLDHLSPNDFIEMMILDGCFLLELFKKFFCEGYKRCLKENFVPAEVLYIENDPIFNMDCMLQYLCHDLMLLENQLPWFVLEILYRLTVEEYIYYPSLSTMVLLTFSSQGSLVHNVESYLSHNGDDDGDDEDDAVLHILDLIRSTLVFQFRKVKSLPCLSQVKLPPATTLSEAGVEFRRACVEGMMNIDFKDGVFTIPQLPIAEMTEPLLRNIIALEQCCHGRSHKITSYVILMHSLIASSKDIDFLCEKEIFLNWFSSENAYKIFNKLYDDTFLKNFYYGELCAEVNKYYNVSWNRWLEKLKRDHLSNPWKITSLVAAFILLALTLLQTTYTIQQYYSPRQ